MASTRNSPLNLSRFLRTLRLFFSSEVRWRAVGWFGLLLALLVFVNVLNVVNSYVGRDFMTAISDRRPRQYASYALLYLGVFAGSTIVAVSYRFAEERLRLLWRTWLTQILIDRYLSHHIYYRVKMKEEIDNPDQRITEDVKSYTQTTLSFFLLFLNATITSLAFLGVLWSITPWLVVVAVAYAAIGSAATVLVGRSLAHLNNLQLKKEADLRYQLIQAREAAEPIALMRVEGMVGAILSDRLARVAENSRAIIAVTRNIGVFTVGYNYLIQLIPLLIVAPLYIRGAVEFGVVTQSAMAFSQVLGAFSLIVTQFEAISAFAAVTERINMIGDVIVEARQASRSTAIHIVEDDGRVAYERLSLWTPQERRPLVQDLSLSVSPGSTLLIAGPNSTAATALILATAGIWDEGEGRILRPPPGLVHFVPQRPFAAPGTLRAQLLITAPGRTFTDDQLLAALRDVGLGPIVARVGGLDAEQDWSSGLSPGEQHLLAFARVLLERPRFVVLDRVFGALGPDQVEHLLRRLLDSSITYLSVGDEQGLLAYHDVLLELRDDGGWRVTAARGALRA
jgi:putative ATP-binding cassette transporter